MNQNIFTFDLISHSAHLGPIWYHSEPSDVPNPPNQFLAPDFFAASYFKIAKGNFVRVIALLWLRDNYL